MTEAWAAVAEAAGRPGFAVLLAACIAAGLVRGFSGFGTALMYMPVATAVVDAPTALVSMLIFDGFGAAALLPWGLRHCRRREVARLFPLASETLFRRAAYAMIFASALVGLPVW